MKNTAKQIQGASLIVTLVVIFLLLLDVVIAIRLVPVYIDNYQIKTTLEAMTQDSTMQDLTKDEIRDFFSRRIAVNNIKNFDLSKLQIDRKQGKLTFTVNYEARVKIVGNVDAVLTFNNRVESE